MDKVECHCTEVSWFRQHGQLIPSSHDCDYVTARDALIERAEQVADQAVPEYTTGRPTRTTTDKWSRAYFKEMERLMNLPRIPEDNT